MWLLKNQYQSDSADHVGANSAMNQSDSPITCNFLKAWRKSHVQGAICFASRWLKNWREILSRSLNAAIA